jgi:hypothetical protein
MGRHRSRPKETRQAQKGDQQQVMPARQGEPPQSALVLQFGVKLQLHQQ